LPQLFSRIPYLECYRDDDLYGIRACDRLGEGLGILQISQSDLAPELFERRRLCRIASESL
jgi:hypothetical protein